MTMLVNRLRHRVTLQRPVTTRTDSGAVVKGYEDVATLWAAVEPLRGREYFAAYAEHVDVTTRIRIRYRDGIDRTMIINYCGRVFEILSIIQPNLQRIELQLMCKERQ